MPATSWEIKMKNPKWSVIREDILYDFRFAREVLQKDVHDSLLWIAKGYGIEWDRLDKWATRNGLTNGSN